MSHAVRITPAGQLLFESALDLEPVLADELANRLDESFSQSPADGLIALASRSADQALPGNLAFWREFAREFFDRICHQGNDLGDDWANLPDPDAEWLQRIVDHAPPMTGLEYLQPELLLSLWHQLRDHVVGEASSHPRGADGFLQSINPFRHLVGRVTFHLAENKRSTEHPFAFMATYAHRVSAQSRLQHLPLGQALREYAGTENREALKSLMEPVRRAAERSTLVRELLDTKAIFHPQAWSVAQARRFLGEVPLLEQSGVVVRIPDWWNPRRPIRPQVQVKLGSKQARSSDDSSLLDFSISLALGDETLTPEECREILETSEQLVLLKGKWVEVDREKLQQALQHWQTVEEEHPDGMDFIRGMRLLAGAQLTRDEDLEQETQDWSRVTAGEWLREQLARLRQPDMLQAAHPGKELRATLRPYQEAGVRWLWFMDRLGLGGCLADDMGLGKTIQVISLLLLIKNQSTVKKRRASLLVVPASLLGNWKQELERFAPSLRVLIAHRSEASEELLERLKDEPAKTIAPYDLVITTYPLIRRWTWLTEVNWRLAILDEAQAIKNSSSAQTRSVKKLRARRRFILTGTPVENHLGELWSLLDFCSPGLLGTATQFKTYVQKLNKQNDVDAYGSLRTLVRPYILRRMKTDRTIIRDLPEKTEMRTECSLSKKQAVLYAKAVQDLERRIEATEGIRRSGAVLNTLMQLKQICNHPAQFLGTSNYEQLESGKWRRLVELCEPIVERQEKVLVFTQFRQLTDPLADHLAGIFGREGLVLHGDVAVKKRSQLVQQFQQDGGPPYFVISLKAGGSGLNLTAASHVIHFDRWWNPAVENQATDRAFRIGQKKNVLVHKFVCRGTVEERIDRMIAEKQELADQLLGEGTEKVLTEMKDDELIEFLSLDLNRAVAE